MATRAPVAPQREILELDWSHGMVRDTSRTALPQGGVWDAVDFMLHKPGMAYKRGGTAYAGAALTGAAYTVGIAYADYPASAQLVALGDNGHLYRYDPASGNVFDAATLGASWTNLVAQPKLYGTQLILTNYAGGVNPKYVTWNGTIMSVADIGGSAPQAIHQEIYKSRLVLANDGGNTKRLWFAPTPNITAAWDITNAWIDADYPISGLAALQNALIVFHTGHTSRLIGSDPPPDTDMDLGVYMATGCTDARSIAILNNTVIFANTRGVYQTNGVSADSLTAQGGIELYWQSLFANYDSASWRLAAGLYRNYYVVSITNASRALVDCLICDVPRRCWWRLSNISASMWATVADVRDSLYYGALDAARAVSAATMFTPAASNARDANGSAVQPFMETILIGQGPQLKTFGKARVTYQMIDDATSNPTLAITTAEGVAPTSFTAVPESPLAETTDVVRTRVALHRRAQAMTLRLTQQNASARTEIYAIQAETWPLMGGGV